MARRHGFTLIELLLVLFILSTLSFMAIEFVGNEDDQARYEGTRDRLGLIRESILFQADRLGARASELSGFVVDNGQLPNSIQDLLVAPTGFDSFGVKFPVFDSSPNTATGINDDAGVLLNATGETVLKGFRTGAYLPVLPGATVAFYDGWGNTAPPANYGWSVTGPPVSFTVSSLGRDNVDNAPEAAGYDADLQMELDATSWQVDAAGWQLEVVNRAGVDLAVDAGVAGACVRASLLVYVNDTDPANDFNWKRLTSECVPGNLTTLADGSCLDGDGDGLVEGIACPATATITFQATGSFQPATTVPFGEHLVVLVFDDDNVPHNGSAGESVCLGATDCLSGSRTTSRFRFIPRSLRPLVQLEIQP
jgi:prepilin-type N-terminal cleavage/methylation domain-containing protein